MASLIPSILVLGLVALVAARVAVKRRSPAEFEHERMAASRLLALATVVQSVHFAEELSAGFHVAFPALLGLEPMPSGAFVVFNVVWIAIWVASVPAIRSARTPAFFAAWFLALAGMLNGAAHPLMALVSGGYFPGLVTSPVIGLVAYFLWRQLQRATRAGET